MLRRIAYVSAAARDVAPEEIGRIVTRSRANNAAHGITGVLLYSGEHFAQLIEGTPGSVSVLWGRVLRDRRHADPSLVFDQFADAPRWFPDWRVGYVLESDLAAEVATWRSLPRPVAPAAIARIREVFTTTDAL